MAFSTTIKVENLFWQVLTEMATQQQTTTNGLIVKLHDEVTEYREDVKNFASFLRVCCLRYMSLQAGRLLDGALPPASNATLRAVS
jgi:predicted DNA-binding ribbon-helix-helix protein